MWTAEMELADDSFVQSIRDFSRSNDRSRPSRSTAGWRRFFLKGFDVRLRERFEIEVDHDALVWMVEVSLGDGGDEDSESWISFRYAIPSRELGDFWSNRARCELRLGKLAETHLRVDLDLVRCGNAPKGPSVLTMIGKSGWPALVSREPSAALSHPRPWQMGSRTRGRD